MLLQKFSLVRELTEDLRLVLDWLIMSADQIDSLAISEQQLMQLRATLRPN